jgi:hypothetical protein
LLVSVPVDLFVGPTTLKVDTVGGAIRLAKAFKEHDPIIYNRKEVMEKFAF